MRGKLVSPPLTEGGPDYLLRSPSKEILTDLQGRAHKKDQIFQSCTLRQFCTHFYPKRCPKWLSTDLGGRIRNPVYRFPLPQFLFGCYLLPITYQSSCLCCVLLYHPLSDTCRRPFHHGFLFTSIRSSFLHTAVCVLCFFSVLCAQITKSVPKEQCIWPQH